MSIDLSITNIWHSWKNFIKGKRRTPEIENYIYNLEDRLFDLHKDLSNDNYKHGSYTYFWVSDSKRRKIAVASVRDRIVHRLLYDYLVNIYDATFIFDVWSCRKNKGLIGAINRTQKFLKQHPKYYIWQADIMKFFDNVDHLVLMSVLSRKITDCRIISLLDEVIVSFSAGFRRTGIPIGNLTSQVFANIYLNELDRFVKHSIKPLAYLRYGDDFIIISESRKILEKIQIIVINYISLHLKLKLNNKNKITKIKHGIIFLGVKIYPNGRKLSNRISARIYRQLNFNNYSSYYGLLKQHQKNKMQIINWQLIDKLEKI